MASATRPRSLAMMFLGFALGTTLLAAPGCGDDPSRMAGTIDVPKRVRPRPDGKGMITTKPAPRDAND